MNARSRGQGKHFLSGIPTLARHLWNILEGWGDVRGGSLRITARWPGSVVYLQKRAGTSTTQKNCSRILIRNNLERQLKMYTANRRIGLSVILSWVVFAYASLEPEQRTANITYVFARVGENATLPCRLDPGNLKHPAFDLKKGSQEVFHYQNGKHYGNGLEGQDPQFKDRVSLPPGGLQAGNATVILYNVTEKDSGEYKFIPLPEKRTSLIRLIVVVDPQLRLTIEEAPQSSGWARLSCVSIGGHPQPRGLVWQTQDGVPIHEVAPTTNSSDSCGRDCLHLNLTVTKPGNYTCLALQQGINPAASTIQLFGNWQSSTGDYNCGNQILIVIVINDLVMAAIIFIWRYKYFKAKLRGFRLSIFGGDGHKFIKPEVSDLEDFLYPRSDQALHHLLSGPAEGLPGSGHPGLSRTT